MTNPTPSTSSTPIVRTSWEEYMKQRDFVTLRAATESGHVMRTFNLWELEHGCPAEVQNWLDDLPDNTYVSMLDWLQHTMIVGYADDIRHTLGLPEALELTDIDEIAAVLIRANDQHHNISVDEMRDDYNDNFIGIYGSWREYSDELAEELHCEHIDTGCAYVKFDYERFAFDLKFDYSVYDLPGYDVAVYTNH